LDGKPLIQHVYERGLECRSLHRLLIATDDDRIREAAEAFGAPVAMTAPDHPSGTDRIAEAASALPEATHLINLQGDEPLLDAALVDLMAATLVRDTALSMITACNPITDPAQLDDPNIVKVVLDQAGDALYFSRSNIPYRRSMPGDLQTYRHMGLYGYRRDFLAQFVSWPPGALEQAEQLEQLRALENGTRIRVLITPHEAIGLDTPDQVPLLEHLLRSLSPPDQPTT
jgi:3-deoxy-manno-octulosonate cytidylyltransferase (CMP-KDO synthetase)